MCVCVLKETNKNNNHTKETQMNGHELDTLDGRVPLCPEGTVIKGRWRVAYQIGMGAFGEIYVARNVSTQERVAIKVEVAMSCDV